MQMSSKDPVQGLIDFALDVKPYHSKILDVSVEYVYSDDVNVTIGDRIFFNIDVDIDNSFAYCEGQGYNGNSWGEMIDGSDPYNIPGDETSGYRTYDTSGSPPTVSAWDVSPECDVRSGPTTVFVTFGEVLDFGDLNLSFEELLQTLIQDDTSTTNWDSTLRANSIVDIDHTISTLYFSGNQSTVGLLVGSPPTPIVRSDRIGTPGKVLAIHGSGNNDGSYTVVSSVYDSGTNLTAVVVSATGSPATALIAPELDPNEGAVGRAVDTASIYYNPILGYELPIPYVFGEDPLVPHGWGDDWWSNGLTGPKIGAKISNSDQFTVSLGSPTLFTVNGALPYSLDQPVYLVSQGSLPRIIYGDLNQNIPLSPYQTYYYIPVASVGSPVVTTFQLSYTAGGPPVDVIDVGSGAHYIGLGESITLFDVLLNTTMDLCPIVDVGGASPADSFFIDGDKVAMYKVGTIFEVEQRIPLGSPAFTETPSYGPNHGEWVVIGSVYDSFTNRTQLTVTRVGGSPYPIGSPYDITPADYIVPYGNIKKPQYTGGQQALTAFTAFTETLVITITEPPLNDIIFFDGDPAEFFDGDPIGFF